MEHSQPEDGLKDLSAPKHLSSRFILIHAVAVATFAVALVLLEWSVKRVPPSYLSAVMFILGAAIGLIGVRGMVEMLEAGEPHMEFREQFTKGRFFTLACPILSPRFWRGTRALKRKPLESGLSPGLTTTKQRLALFPLLLAPAAGWAAGRWLGAPAHSVFLAFIGCGLTLFDLSLILWHRRLKQRTREVSGHHSIPDC